MFECLEEERKEELERAKVQSCLWVNTLPNTTQWDLTHAVDVCTLEQKQNKYNRVKCTNIHNETNDIETNIYIQTKWIYGSVKYSMISLKEMECDLNDSEERKRVGGEKENEKVRKRKWFQRSGNITPIAAKSRD